MSVYIGIDPGLDGAIARLARGELVVVDMPTIVVTGKRREVDTRGVRDLLAGWGASTLIAIEDVNAAAVVGRGSAFAFGRGVGRIEGVLDATARRWQRVPPGTWTRALGRGTGKDGSLALAAQLFPAYEWPRSKDGWADAALIAEWARRTDGGGR